jgi:hypothetical protein
VKRAEHPWLACICGRNFGSTKALSSHRNRCTVRLAPRPPRSPGMWRHNCLVERAPIMLPRGEPRPQCNRPEKLT